MGQMRKVWSETSVKEFPTITIGNNVDYVHLRPEWVVGT